MVFSQKHWSAKTNRFIATTVYHVRQKNHIKEQFSLHPVFRLYHGTEKEEPLSRDNIKVIKSDMLSYKNTTLRGQER